MLGYAHNRNFFFPLGAGMASPPFLFCNLSQSCRHFGIFLRCNRTVLLELLLATHPAKCEFKTTENAYTVGIAVRCDREVGASATHLSFSCLLFHPVLCEHCRPFEAFRKPSQIRPQTAPSGLFPTFDRKAAHRATGRLTEEILPPLPTPTTPQQ